MAIIDNDSTVSHKLCCKTSDDIKEYKLKNTESVPKPRLACVTGGLLPRSPIIEYVHLVPGVKSGQLHVLGSSNKTYHIDVRGYEGYTTTPVYFAYFFDDEILESFIWPIYNENKVILAMIMSVSSRTHERKNWGAAVIDVAMSYNSHVGSVRRTDTPTIEGYLGLHINPGIYNKVLCKIWCTGDAFVDVSGNVGKASTISIVRNRLLYGTDRYENSTSGDIYEIRDLTETTENWLTDYASTTNLRDFDTNRMVASPNSFYTFNGGGGEDSKNHSWLQFIKLDSEDTSKKYIGIYTQNRVYQTTRVANYDAFFEFPENGTLGVSPTELITEWVAAVGASTTLEGYYQ